MQVDRDDAPVAGVAGIAIEVALDVIEPGQRAIVDGEGEGPLRLAAERQRERGADRAAMGDRDDVAAAIEPGQPRHRLADAVDHLVEALAAGRRLVRRRQPEAVPLAIAALPD